MALVFVKMVVSLLFAMSLFHKIYQRSVSLFLILVMGFTWVLMSSFELGDVGLWIMGFCLIFLYWRAMQKPSTDKVL